jgi:hypothetical protein
MVAEGMWFIAIRLSDRWGNFTAYHESGFNLMDHGKLSGSYASWHPQGSPLLRLIVTWSWYIIFTPVLNESGSLRPVA